MFDQGAGEALGTGDGAIVGDVAGPSPTAGGDSCAASVDAGTVRAAAVGSAAVPADPSSRLWAERHPVAARLEDLAPSPVMVAELAGVDVARADEATLVEVVAAWERVASWVAARQAEAVGQPSRRMGAGPQGVDPFDAVVDEVSARLAVSRRSGQSLVVRALGLEESPAVREALAGGSVSVRKADVLLDGTAHLAVADALAVQEAVVGRAGSMTVPQLRHAVRVAEQWADPRAAAQRHERARADRCVVMTPAADAMAWVRAYLPAQDAATVMTAVDALAGFAAPGDDRGIDARRADALVDTMREVLDGGVDRHGRALPVRQRRRPHLSVTAPLAVLAGQEDGPVSLAGYGPVPAFVGRIVAAEAEWSVVAVDPVTGEVAARSARSYRPTADVVQAVVDRDVVCTFPGCRVPAERCDLDHTVPLRDGVPAERQTRTDNLAALCRHHHLMKTRGPWRPQRDGTTGVVRWHSASGRTYTRDPVPALPEPPPRRIPPPTTDPDEHRRPAGDGSGPAHAGRAGPPRATGLARDPSDADEDPPPF